MTARHTRSQDYQNISTRECGSKEIKTLAKLVNVHKFVESSTGDVQPSALRPPLGLPITRPQWEVKLIVETWQQEYNEERPH